MIGLLSPIALASLVALALPIVIHLRQQPVQQVVDFAALRWLPSRPLPHARWRWHDRWLLLLRLVLIAATVLLLARPVWHATEVAGAPWVVVSPDVPLAAARAAVVAPGAQWRWLAPGWPAADGAPLAGRSAALANAAPAGRSAAWASLLRELDDTLPAATAITVVVPMRLVASDAVAPQLRRRVVWRPVAVDGAPRVRPGASTDGDQQRTGADHATAPRLQVAFHAANGAGDELAVARALVRAWHAGAPALGWDVPLADAESPAIDLAHPIDAAAAVVFWLGGAPSAALQAWVAGGGTAVVTRHACPDGRPLPSDDSANEPLFTETPHGRGRLICLATPLTPQTTPLLRNPAVPAMLLAAAVAGRDRPAPLLADAALLAPGVAEGQPPPRPGQPLDTPFAIAIAALFLAERWWSTRLGRPAGRDLALLPTARPADA